jgi:glutathione S-transferase
MALEIIGFPRSNFVRSVRMAAHEKGIEYDLIKANPHSDEVKAIHPMGQIPVMRHNGFELCESQAIIRYMEAVFDGSKLIPEDPKEAATINQWISMANTSIDKILMRQYVVPYVFLKDENGNVIRTEIDLAVKRFPSLFRKLDKIVAGGYFGSREFTAADCIFAPILAAALNFPEAKEALQACPNLQAYVDRISQRPSFIETAA